MEAEFVIGQKVRITTHGINGVVNGIYQGRQGVQYEVEYLSDSGISSRYFVGSELAEYKA